MRFAGYAAVFGHPDRGGDVVQAGAFERTLKRGAGAVPLLWQHEAGRPIGRIEYLREDERGLRVIARLSEGAAALFVGTGGDLVVRGAGGGADATFKNVQSGSILPLRAQYVRASGTNAADIVALY